MATATAVELKTFSFEFTLVTPTPIDSADRLDELHSALFKQGCTEDGSLGTTAGTAYLSFDRQAPDLADAIGSALRQVQKAGYSVARIEVDPT